MPLSPDRLIHRQSSPRRHRRKSGFAIVLVLLLLLMMAILVIAYLRVMRMRMVPHARTGNIDSVTSSILDRALGQIADDMPLQNGHQENYDYPWTDVSSGKLPAQRFYPMLVRGETSGDPAHDDAWLATGYVEQGTWPHLTNLMGSFLDVPSADLTRVDPHPATHQRVPADAFSAGRENQVSLNDPRLVDADGDGVNDSFWFYPPVNFINGVRYVAAVSIEDLSGKINLNVTCPLDATDMASSAGILGRTPSDVNMAALTTVFGAPDPELTRATRFRFGPTQPTGSVREMAWLRHASHAQLTGEPLLGDLSRFTPEDEIELRFHGGLNDHRLSDVYGARQPVTTAVESADHGFPALLRCGSNESNWSTAGFRNAEDWINLNPRRWVTTLSGEGTRQIGLHAPLLSESIRYNLNIRNDEKFGSALCDWSLRRWLTGPDGLDGTADDYPAPRGFKRFVGSDAELPLSFASQWSANLIDARDKDNRPTELRGWYGWEPLPMLTQAYMQAYYIADGSTIENGRFVVDCKRNGTRASYAFELANPYDFDLKLINLYIGVGTPGHFFLNKPATQPFGIQSLLGAWADHDADGDPVLKPGHTLILWDNGTGGTKDTRLDARIKAAVNNDPARIHAVQSTSLQIRDAKTNDEFVQVGLYCETESADGISQGRAAFPYSLMTLPWLRETFREQISGIYVPRTGDGVGYRQSVGIGFGSDTGLNLLQCRASLPQGLAIPSPIATATVTGDPSSLGDMRMAFTKATDGYDANLFSSLGLSAKVPLPRGRSDLRNDRLFFAGGRNPMSAGEFTSVADLLRVPVLGFRGHSADHRGALTLTDASGTPLETDVGRMTYELLEGGMRPLDDLFFSMSSDNNVYDADTTETSCLRVPWGWLLPCLYDTINPAMQGGYDLDGDGILDWSSSRNLPGMEDGNNNGIKDWLTEVDLNGHLVPGRINLNTMPPNLLKAALPIADPALCNALGDAIVQCRSSAPAKGTRQASDRGLSSVIELLPTAATLASYAGRPRQDRNGDGQIDGADAERNALVSTFGNLANFGSCRSDFFAIHILVQGYPADDFSTGPVESQRMLAIVSRSAMTSAGATGQLKTWIYRY